MLRNARELRKKFMSTLPYPEYPAGPAPRRIQHRDRGSRVLGPRRGEVVVVQVHWSSDSEKRRVPDGNSLPAAATAAAALLSIAPVVLCPEQEWKWPGRSRAGSVQSNTPGKP